MIRNISDFDQMATEDSREYALSNATGQAFGFALAYAISNRHLFNQKNGVQEFSDALYDTFTEHLPVPLSEESIAVLHGIVEGMAKAILAEEA